MVAQSFGKEHIKTCAGADRGLNRDVTPERRRGRRWEEMVNMFTLCHHTSSNTIGKTLTQY